MQENKEKEYINLSKEELISLLLKTASWNGAQASDGAAGEADALKARNAELEARGRELEARNSELEARNRELDAENKELAARNRELQQKLENAELLAKKARLERFVNASDNAFMTKQEKLAYSRAKPLVTAKKRKEKAKRPERTYTRDDLMRLSEGNDVISNDILPKLREEHPDWEFRKIGEDVSFVLERVKAHIVVHRVVTPKYGTSNDRGQIFQAQSVAPIPHSYAGPGLLADLCTAKFQFGMPVYRYHSWIHGCGFDFPMRTLYGYLMKCAGLLRPIYAAIEKAVRETKAGHIGIDETYLKVIDEIGDEREHCYVYVLQCRDGDRRIRLFRYTGTRESDYVKRLLSGYGGTIVVDGYSGYDSMPDGIGRQRCLSHLRRKFADIAKAADEKSRKDSAAYQAVKLLDRIFGMESSMRERGLTPFETLSERNSEEYRKAVSDFRGFVSGIEAAKDSPLGKAVTYYLNGGDEFFTFLECGDVPIDNNETERSCKQFAANRRGFLFCRSADGAEAASVLTTVIKTAEANGLYPDEYLSYVFSHVSDSPASALMPWSDEVRKAPGIAIKKQKSGQS